MDPCILIILEADIYYGWYFKTVDEANEKLNQYVARNWNLLDEDNVEIEMPDDMVEAVSMYTDYNLAEYSILCSTGELGSLFG